MNKEMIISSGGHDTRVAILEDDQVVEIFIERENQRGVVGNVYKGRVSKVLPGMQSSFVDIGLERDAFLYVSEVVTPAEFDRLEGGDDDDGPAAAAGPREIAESPSRCSPKGAVKASPAAVADEAPTAARASATATAAAAAATTDRPEARIEDLLKEGQEVLVQVVKEPLGTKGARLTSHVTMPGRFLVFMPTVDHVGVSRKIESREERARLRGIVREFREEHGFTGGVIIRTAASGRSKEDIVTDLAYFHQVWTEIRQKMETRRPPAVLFQEQSLVTKLLRDLLTDDYTRDPSRQRAGAPPRRDARRADHAEPAAAGEALHEGLPDLRGVRRPGGDRQGAAQQGVAEVGRLPGDQPDRSAGRDRRQHRPLRRQEVAGAARRHDRQDEPRGGEGDRPPDPPARPRRHHRARPDRHGGEEEPPEGLHRRSRRSCAATARRRRRCRCRTSAS